MEEGDEISLFMADETIEKFSTPLPQLEALEKNMPGTWKNLEKPEKGGKWQQEEKAGVIHYI